MNTQSLFNAIQLITGIAVVVGLVLVMYELRQTKVLTRAELASEFWIDYLEQQRVLMGETLFVAFAKNCSGREVSAEEKAQLIAYLNHIWARGMRMEEVGEIGDFDRGPNPAFREGIVKEYLTLPLGRELWNRGDPRPQGYSDIAKTVMAAGWTGCDSWFIEPSG